MKCARLLSRIYTALEMAVSSPCHPIVFVHVPAYDTRAVFADTFGFPPELYDRLGTAEIAVEYQENSGNFSLRVYWYGSDEWMHLTHGTEREIVAFILKYFGNYITAPVKFTWEEAE